MNDMRDRRVPFDNCREAARLREIEVMKFETFLSSELRQTRFFERDRIVVVKIIYTDNVLASTQQRMRRMKSNEAGDAGHNDGQGSTTPRKNRAGRPSPD